MEGCAAERSGIAGGRGRGRNGLGLAVVVDVDLARIDRLFEAEEVAEAKATRAASEDGERRRRDRHGARRRDDGAVSRPSPERRRRRRSRRERRCRREEVARARSHRERFERALVERRHQRSPGRTGARPDFVRRADEDELVSIAGDRGVGQAASFGGLARARFGLRGLVGAGDDDDGRARDAAETPGRGA